MRTRLLIASLAIAAFGVCFQSAAQTTATNKSVQTLVLERVTVKHLSEGAFTVSPSTTSQLPVALSSKTSTVCTVTGNSVTPVAPGMCLVNVSQPGNAVFSAAQASYAIRVVKTPQAIDFDGITTQPLATGSLTARASATSGLAVTLASLTPATCTIAGRAVTLIATGKCTLVASQPGTASIAAAPDLARTFVIAKAAQAKTITTRLSANAPQPSLNTTATAVILGADAGTQHACALTSVGGVKCWGDNGAGQLGDGTTNEGDTPVDTQGLAAGITNVYAGSTHSCAITAASTVKCWGYNAYGQLGDGTTNQQNSPVAVLQVKDALMLAVGINHTCVLVGNNAAGNGVRCWGANGYGQLGDGTGIDSPSPVDVYGLTSGVASLHAKGNHTCAVLTNGSVQCWGSNFHGEIGDGTTNIAYSPVAVPGQTGILAVAGGAYHTCSVTTGGTAKCWGYNVYGELGDATNTDRHSPTAVSGISSGATGIDAGDFGSCALISGGSAKCWGGSYQSSTTPLTITSLNANTLRAAAGGNFGCGVNNVGAMQCWNANNAGQRGDGSGSPYNSNTATQVVGFTGGTAVAQTVSFTGSFTDHNYGSGTVSVAATATSGLTVTITSLTTDVCTTSGTNGTTVTLVAGGPCTLAGNQGGNASYLPAPQATRTFAVIGGQRSQTISFSPPATLNQPVYSSFYLSATASSGLPVTFGTATPNNCAVTSNWVFIFALGTCTLTADQAGNGGYFAAPQVQRNVLITQLTNQSITFNSLSNQALGTGPITVSATASSGLAVSFSSQTTGTCTTSGTNGATVTLIAVGTCTIAASQAGDTTYAPAPTVTQSFIILASQSITFGALADQNFGAAPITVSATASSGLAVTFSSQTTGICTTSGTNGATVTMLAVGTCTIAAGQAGNGTYAAAPTVTRSFRVKGRLYFVHTDHLGTPRTITETTNNAKVWEWANNDPFGNNQANQDPNSTGTQFVYNNRFPGQYSDAESGTYYNYFRTYNPAIGRYEQSDPIGLKGGLNTYGYVGQSPLEGMDRLGLIKVYGNWCGPDWTGGFKKTWDEMSLNERKDALPPIGPLDAACQTHDVCYGGCRAEYPCNPINRSACFRACDYDLTRRAYEVGGFWGRVVGSAIDRPGERDAGKNDPKCKNCDKDKKWNEL